MYTYSDTGNQISQLPSTSGIETTNSDTDSDLNLPSSDSLPPSPKQPRNEQEHEVSAAYTDVADLAKRRISLMESEKYNFYCNHFTPDIDYKFPCEGGRSFLHRYLRKYSWLTYSRQENGGYCLPCVLFARSTDVRKLKVCLSRLHSPT